MNKPLRFVAPAALLAGGLLITGAAQAAKHSSLAESRGYQGCVDAAERELDLIKVDADYYIYEHSDSRQLYLNGYAFQNGDATPVKIACETTLSGIRVLDLKVGSGSYAGRMVDPVDVASN